MPKTAVFTTITPLPAGITRKSVLDMYHDHLAMIDLNPLVVERFMCKPPAYAPTDEYWAKWYTVKDKVSYLPGGLATGSVSYHACFTDTADGLSTHVYAPLGLNIQGKWTVGGRLPGEPKPPAEPGLETPRHGLYIREDVKMTCSSLLLSFVKRTFKDSHGQLVDKLVERAHILESSFANERLQQLRGIDPGERMGHGDILIALPPDLELSAPAPSPRSMSHTRSQSDPILSPGFSSSSTLNGNSESNSPTTKRSNRHISFVYVHEEKPLASSAPEQSSFLLPATTYDGGASPMRERPISMMPATPSAQNSERVISLLPFSPHNTEAPQQNQQFFNMPRTPYSGRERPISFTFPFDPKQPFDRKSNSQSSQPEQQNILDDIDDAIDEFMYTLPATAYNTLPAARYNSDSLTLSNAIYNPAAPAPEPVLSSAKYDPKHERKDSFMPFVPIEEDERPPVPLKDDKYRKGSIRG
ncbi:hypothetical protein CFE70_007736 [Pyrenophora teres f. teres 0-1]|uniref:DUF7053 domain-containing protein n=2 Tax=Pyrenophora teres f. teres TaxID=97479 RepID=E3S1Z6_PYRTT|nr:hypothetical protein PTT_16299 [Pyrenophora teres f. teres 0-1]KAE8825289.1 hypothetical protein HRS9139_08399 [Pyrenophora teres f. teres]CAA9963623.1 hypothetical protein PTMSG1_06984 [Pyrenophora teres f. maculata]KAE8834383.1 hypothetical protein PTNB85_05716 [Pyrenophora teres f. teres]KAE8844135.1 hypothetical protein HRS9122_05238 [Pyrenophora teres f. teres]